MRLNPISNINETANLRTLINIMARQMSDNTGTFTASTGTTTTVANKQVSANSKIFITPRSQESADARWFVSSIGNGSFVVGHIANSTTRTFDYMITDIT
ncbi:hypothetical protein [Rhizobium skierniewicense]|uniref:hypothetical protein n=1 Tax=Rhizobium skierniewicense TaxID=984260 RepID=UPI0015743B87|nr:hypothetical protein [Rhizobium skierniewicense]NTF34252.1 hypothetical protein [Rhizobium skierniewicense]